VESAEPALEKALKIINPLTTDPRTERDVEPVEVRNPSGTLN
jgi:hypothetical protein